MARDITAQEIVEINSLVTKRTFSTSVVEDVERAFKSDNVYDKDPINTSVNILFAVIDKGNGMFAQGSNSKTGLLACMINLWMNGVQLTLRPSELALIVLFVNADIITPAGVRNIFMKKKKSSMELALGGFGNMAKDVIDAAKSVKWT